MLTIRGVWVGQSAVRTGAADARGRCARSAVRRSSGGDLRPGPSRTADRPPAVAESVEAVVEAAHDLLGPDKHLVIEPGRSLVANSTVTFDEQPWTLRALKTKLMHQP